MKKRRYILAVAGILFVFFLGFSPNIFGVDNFTTTISPGSGESPETFQYTILKDQQPGKYSFTSIQWYHLRFMIISREGKIINITKSSAF